MNTPKRLSALNFFSYLQPSGRKGFVNANHGRVAQKTWIIPPVVLALILFITSGTAAAMEDRYALLDGVRVHYQNYGTGTEAVIFIHGWACNASFWHSNVSAFVPTGRVIVLDLPGHGDSDKPRVAYTQEYLARGVDAVLRDAGVYKAYVIGHSMGMTVARYFLQAHPEKVIALVNVDSRSLFYGESTDTSKAQRAQFAQALRGPQAAQTWQERIERYFVPETPPAVRDEVRTKMPLTPTHVAVSASESLQSRAWSLQPTSVPTLAIYAKPVAPLTEQVLRRMFTDLKYQEWEGTGHFLMLVKPKEFNETVLAFIGQLRARRGTTDRH
jgi:pimeloyl-ACP methyl ester carboxylesterase